MRPNALPLRFLPAIAIALTGLAGCVAQNVTPFADDSAAQAAPYPALIPIGQIVAQAQSAPAETGAADSVAARVAALQARAAALRGPVVPDATSERLANALR